jgi:hypothetical protein
MLETKEIPLEKLTLDPTNPRYWHLGPLSEQQLEEYIWKESETKDLLKAIWASKGIIEPLYTLPSDGLYVVKEGNRRTVCLRKLSELVLKGDIIDFPADYFKRIPCFILPPGTSDRDIARILAQLHVAGKKPWDALNQAAYIYKLHHSFGYAYEDLRALLQLSKPTIIKRLKAYEATLTYLKKYPNDKIGIKRFSYFDELLKNKYTRVKLSVDPSFLDDFFDWVATGKLRNHRDVRLLRDILEDEELANVFKSAGIEEALKLLYVKYPPKSGDPLWLYINTTTTLLKQMPRSEILEIATNERKRELFMALFKEVQEVINEVEKRQIK